MPRAIRGFRARPQIVRCRWPGRCLWRQRYLLILQGGLLQLLLLLLFYRECRRDAASPLAVEKSGILFVDVLLFFRCRIRTRDIEVPVLHEIEIGIAAAGVAAGGGVWGGFG